MTYTYDVLNRLATAKDNRMAAQGGSSTPTMYSYDPAGNLSGYAYSNLLQKPRPPGLWPGTQRNAGAPVLLKPAPPRYSSSMFSVHLSQTEADGGFVVVIGLAA